MGYAKDAFFISNTVLVAAQDGGLVIVDVSDPASPSVSATYQPA